MANRVSQEAIEVVELPSDAKARLSQQAVEVIERPSDAQARLSQIVVEILHPSFPPTLEATQVVWVW